MRKKDKATDNGEKILEDVTPTNQENDDKPLIYLYDETTVDESEEINFFDGNYDVETEDDPIDKLVEETEKKQKLIKEKLSQEKAQNPVLNIHIPVWYMETNEQRWQLAKYLIEQPYGYITPVFPFDMGEHMAGKVPAFKDWFARNKPTIEDLEAWRGKDEFMNLGLVLGGKSGIIAVNINGGEEGAKILFDISNGKLPQTVQFKTPNNGMTYLYRIPKKYQDNRFRKFTKRGKAEESKCVLLGDGCQVVLPYSIHVNGGVYKFIAGKSFTDINIAPAPTWLLDLTMKTPQKINTPQTEKMNRGLKKLCDSCPRLGELADEQQQSGLDKKMWILVLKLLIANGYLGAARNFSRLSTKHDSQSDKQIYELLNASTNYSVKCTSLGCQNMANCFDEPQTNNAGKIITSPSSYIEFDKEKQGDIGIVYDRDGYFVGINGNMYARFLLKNFDLAFHDEMGFFLYIGYWKRMTEHQLKKLFYKLFQRIAPDKLFRGADAHYFELLPFICRSTDSLLPAKNYINVMNGLFNITTFRLEPHDSNVFSTTQLPVTYDIKAQCNRFLSFLHEVLCYDIETIDLVQEIAGYVLSCETKAERLFVLLGDGSNGKSLLCEVFLQLAGGEKNVSSVSLGNLEKEFKVSQIVGKTLNISTENEVKTFDTEAAKAITSGDAMQVEFKFGHPFTYKPFAKLLFSVNRLPYLGDKSYGMERRLIIIPFDKRFSANPVTPMQGLKDPLLKETLPDELDGIFAFAMDGLERLIKNKYEFTDSKRVSEILNDYRLDTNPYLDFVRTCIESAEENDKNNRRLSSKELENVFNGWCAETNHSGLMGISNRKLLKELRLTLENENISYKNEKSNGETFLAKIKFNANGKKYITSVVRRPLK